MLRARVQSGTKVQRPRALTGRRMWLAIFVAVVYHELFCEKDQLLSEAVDRGLPKYRAAIYSFTAVTVAHLLNLLPPKIDPYRWFDLINPRMKGTNDHH